MNGLTNGMAGFDSLPAMPQGYPVENIFAKEGDDKRTAIFYLHPVLNQQKSMTAGYPIHDDVLYCKHYTIGEIHIQCSDVPATDELKHRYRRQWEFFIQTNGQPGQHSGMDLALLFPASPSLVLQLKATGIHTVEELAAVEAQGMAMIGMGAMEWKQKAIKFLAQAKDTAAVSKLNAELAKRDEKIDALLLQVQQLTTAMNQRFINGPVMNDDGHEVEETAPVRRGPGRPRKVSAFSAEPVEPEEVT